MLYKDKEVERQKAEHAEEKHTRRIAVPLTMVALMEIATLTAVGNDSTWESPAKVLRTQDLERLASKKFWRELKVKDGFKDILKVVLPNVWQDSMAEEKVKKTKLMPVIGTHLQLVSDIAHKKVDNTISEVDISDMTRSEILVFARSIMHERVSLTALTSGGTKSTVRVAADWTGSQTDDDSDGVGRRNGNEKMTGSKNVGLAP
jgi:hypothetical protein